MKSASESGDVATAATVAGEQRARVNLQDPSGWQFRLTPAPAKRLIVFVHGFGGVATRTWKQFWNHPADCSWWAESDLLFTTYDSIRGHVTGGANLLSAQLPKFYPILPEWVTEIDGVAWRDSSPEYSELLLVAHSLGGVLVRKVMLDALDGWDYDGRVNAKPPILQAGLRFFSPATSGFMPTGFAGLLYALRNVRAIAETILSISPAYKQLQIGSPILEQIEHSTLDRVSQGHVELRARIVWAEKDRIVDARRYTSDFPEGTIPRRGHMNVCKPNAKYAAPWDFVKKGRI